MKLAIAPDYASRLWETLPEILRTEIRAMLLAINNPPEKGRVAWFKSQAKELGVSPGTFRAKFYAVTTSGDWTVLVPKHYLEGPELATTREPRFVCHLLALVEDFQRKNLPAFRELRRQWLRRDPIPGYEGHPGWPKIPEGWSNRNLADIVAANTKKEVTRAARVGVSSKTNPFLPTVLTTRTKLWQGAVIQMDDMWHDNYVTVDRNGKPHVARVLELAAVDLFSAHRFHWGLKPRLRRADGTMENLGSKDARLFLAGLLHRFGSCPRGMSFMVEHATMSIPEDIERLLYDYSRGMIRVSRQPIEGKQAALTGFWNGSEGGNFRAKALIESLGNLIHNDLSRLPMQVGSPSSGLLGPVTTERHRAWLEKTIATLEEKVPHRLKLFKRTGTMDFFSEFIPFITDYYEFGLGRRTDHDLEGWEELRHFVTEYTTAPGSDTWLPRELLLDEDRFDPDSAEIILRNAQRQPKLWQRRRPLSPVEVWNRRGQWQPVPPALICDILTRDLSRECTARNGFLRFSDKEFAPYPLVYEAAFVSGPRRGERIGHGEKILMFANPYDDERAMVVDAKGRFQGELPLYQRVTAINPEAFGSDAPFEDRPELMSSELKEAAGRKHAAIAQELEPYRIRHAGRVQEAREIRAEAKRLADPDAAFTPEEIAARNARIAGKGRDTKRANRVKERAAKVDTSKALSAWSSRPQQQPPPEPEPPAPESKPYNPFS